MDLDECLFAKNNRQDLLWTEPIRLLKSAVTASTLGADPASRWRKPRAMRFKPEKNVSLIRSFCDCLPCTKTNQCMVLYKSVSWVVKNIQLLDTSCSRSPTSTIPFKAFQDLMCKGMSGDASCRLPTQRASPKGQQSMLVLLQNRAFPDRNYYLYYMRKTLNSCFAWSDVYQDSLLGQSHL